MLSLSRMSEAHQALHRSVDRKRVEQCAFRKVPEADCPIKGCRVHLQWAVVCQVSAVDVIISMNLYMSSRKVEHAG